MLKIFKPWLPVFLCTGFIFYTSSIPGTDIPSLFPYQDIIYHAFIYLVLAYFFARALKKTKGSIAPAKIIVFTLLFGIIFGISDEFHQSFVPNRTPSGWDVLIDGIGTFLGGLICRFQM